MNRHRKVDARLAQTASNKNKSNVLRLEPVGALQTSLKIGGWINTTNLRTIVAVILGSECLLNIFQDVGMRDEL